MLRLLPPVCRDCGKSAGEVALSPYLDFQLCPSCIGRRERELMAADSEGRRNRRVASSNVEEPPAPAPGKRRASPKSEAPVKANGSAKPDGKARKPAAKKKTSTRRPLKH